MKILIGCEFSQIITNAFRLKGHDAWSCDLKAVDSPYHIQVDILTILNQNWDMLIAHPPCTYLCRSGERWLTTIPKRKLNPNVKYGMERFYALRDASNFFKALLDAPINRICLENPRMHTLAIIQVDARSSQVIQPYQFGHLESKETHLWLKNLPLLSPTNNVYEEMMKLPITERQKNWHMNPKNRINDERSITFKGVAEAMSEQWNF